MDLGQPKTSCKERGLINNGQHTSSSEAIGLIDTDQTFFSSEAGGLLISVKRQATKSSKREVYRIFINLPPRTMRAVL